MGLGIGQRIKQRRNELSITQDELAHRMGYKSKAAICKVENGEDNITTDRIAKFAKALNCSPSYLMGWTAQPFYTPEEYDYVWFKSGGGKHPLTLSDEEYALILTYRKADNTTRGMVDRILMYTALLEEREKNGKR